MEPSLFQRLRKGLEKSREGWVRALGSVFGGRQWDAGSLAAMEEVLLSADVGVRGTERLIDSVRRRFPAGGGNAEELASCLKQEILKLLEPGRPEGRRPLSRKPWIVLFLGVNGVGKTTTIGKMAARYVREGKRVLLVAADTFRAAAAEQLEAWGEKVGAQVIKHRPGSDPSAVAFDAIHAARKRNADVVLIDTAGRLHTKSHLVEELKKMRRIIAREEPGAPHETLLVLDATTGQNALQQARVFKESLEVTGIVLTKLDGTAKGGVIVGIQEELGIPVHYIGIGEEIEDLQPFDARAFVEALFDTGVP